MIYKLFSFFSFSIYFFRKSKQKASSLSNRFAFKVVRDDILFINKIEALLHNANLHSSFFTLHPSLSSKGIF